MKTPILNWDNYLGLSLVALTNYRGKKEVIKRSNSVLHQQLNLAK